MIKQILSMSLVLVSAQAIASAPCPTCSKIYPSIEEILITHQNQKEKGSNFNKVLEGYSIAQDKKRGNAQEKSHVTNIVNRAPQNTHQPPASRSRAPKRDEVLGSIDASPTQPQIGSVYFSQDQGNKNLRGTFDKTTAFGMQQQLRQHIRNLKR